MSEKFIVTITREFGSMGRPIARRLSELLNVEFYDRDIVEETARQMELPLSVVSKNEDFRVQSEIIRKLAAKESCVIVGRCAEYVLSDFKNCFNIYIYAPFEKRIENCVTQLGMEEDVAIKMIMEVDKARRKYHKKYTNYYPSDLNNRNLMIDSSFFGVEGTAQMVVDIVRKHFGESETIA